MVLYTQLITDRPKNFNPLSKYAKEKIEELQTRYKGDIKMEISKDFIREHFVNGISMEIANCERAIARAHSYLEDMDLGCFEPTPAIAKRSQLLDLIAKKRARIDWLRARIVEFDFTDMHFEQ